MNQAISTFRGWTVGLAATSALWCGAVAWGAGGAPGTGSEADELAILQSEASPGDKALACKRLAVVGSADAVDELAPLLADPQLASWARIALQAIEGPEAGEALRAALQRVSGRERIGIINTLGVRREAAAAPALIELLRQQDDAEAASAAAVTLGRIGGDAAATALRQALADARPQVRSAAAEGCVLWAEQLAAQGDAAAAKALYEQVLQASTPEQRQLEARRGRILASGVDGGKLLVEELAAAAPARFALGLTVLRETPQEVPLDAVLQAWAEWPADRQALVVLALGDRGGASVKPLIVQAAQSGPLPVRLAAIDALMRLGDDDLLPQLLELTRSDEDALRDAATVALRQFGGAATDAAIVQRLSSAQGAELRALVELAGLRRINAVSELLPALDDADAATRQAALVALGAIVDFNQLPMLIERVLSPRHEDDRAAALRALQTAAIRMPDREACGKRLAEALAQAPGPLQAQLIPTLAEVGGGAALACVAEAAKSADAQVADAATVALGRWMTADAAGPLWDLAQPGGDSRHQVRALRGYLRIARQFDVPDAQRMEMCARAWEAAQRDDERQLVLQILKRYPTEAGLRLAVQAAREASVRDAAAEAARAIGEKIEHTAEVRDLLDRLQLLLLQEGPGPAAFRKLRLHDKFVSEGAYAADFNRDGTLDVVAGPYWYAGPDFAQRHEVREPKEFDPHGYSDNFLTYVDDFNADGWTDILYVPWPGEDASWYENPGDRPGPWRAHFALKNVGNESPVWIDVDGDGRCDLVFNIDGYLGYGSWDPERPGEPWKFRTVSTQGPYQRYTHGVGCGDLNGDGRLDILESGCWWEQPADAAADAAWTRHEYPFAAAGAQMLVTDVDGDGLHDVVTSWHAHGYGLVWHRQVRAADGGLTFERQEVLPPEPDLAAPELRISQMHALALADMNGDGVDDVVTGKRFWAHGPEGDVEPAAPAALLWFEIDRGPEGRVRFVPHLIDDDSGVGTQVATAQLNADDVPDPIVSNKKGVFVFLSR